MIKTLVSTAILTFVGAACAQSSITLYGRIDASIGGLKAELGDVTTADKGIQIRSGVHTGSRWGMKGSEDLGAGLRADFQLEQGFNVDDGTPSRGRSAATVCATLPCTDLAVTTRQFHRQAWVGLSGAFGALQLGRQNTTIDNVYTEYDALELSGYSAASYAFNAGAYVDSSRIDNAVYYKTPSIAGLRVGGLWAAGENKNGAAGSLKSLSGLQVLYAQGPLSVGGAWESQTFNGFSSSSAWDLGASYDLGSTKLFGQIEGANNQAANSKDAGYEIGIKVPMGAPTLLFAYARENLETAGTRVSTASAYSLMAQYTLSTRTYLYAAYLRGTTDPVVGATARLRSYGLGLVHNF